MKLIHVLSVRDQQFMNYDLQGQHADFLISCDSKWLTKHRKDQSQDFQCHQKVSQVRISIVSDI